MITNFKLYENQETILNRLLDKIQEFGKDSLTSNELNFLTEYPNAKLAVEKEIKIEVRNPHLRSFATDLFWFEQRDVKKDEITNTYIISGIMVIAINEESISLDGYFVINIETEQIFPYFSDDEGFTAYDYVKGHEDAFYDFLEEIYEKNNTDDNV